MDYTRYKIPVRIISSIGSILLFIHIVAAYLYVDGEKIGEVGGSLSIGIIAEGPGDTLNPLEYGQNIHKDMILRFMFRSLIRNVSDGKGYLGDLARCDLSNLNEVVCTVSEDATWSDRSLVRTEDIVKTVNALKEQSQNQKMANFLKNVTITGSGNQINIKNNGELNSLMLELLTYPIVRSDMVELIKTKRVTEDNYITTGPYTFGGIEKDATFGFDKITLMRDPVNGKNAWIEKYHFKFFADKSQLEKNIDTLNIILPYTSDPIAGGDNPRFADLAFNAYEYIGLFFQAEKVTPALRTILAGIVNNSISGKEVAENKPIQNIFFTTGSMIPANTGKTLPEIMRDMGYTRRDEILGQIAKLPILLTGSAIEYRKNAFFQSPTMEKIYFASGTEESIVISGNVPSNIEKVEINGYALREYLPGNNTFTYRVMPERGNLVKGKNEYTLSFVYTNGKRTTPESLTIYYLSDESEKAATRKLIEDAYLKELNTPELVAKRQQEIQTQRLAVDKLDPRFFYDKDYKPYTMRLLVMNEPKENELYSTWIKKGIGEIGINLETQSITEKNLSSILEKGDKSYDMLLLGFEATPKITQLSQFFESGRASTGLNFSKIKNKRLDELFSQYKVAPDSSAFQKLENEIINILQNEAVLVPIASPERALSVDRNLRGVELPPIFGDLRNLSIVLTGARIKEVYVMNLKNKSVSHFFQWAVGGKP